MKDYVLKIAIPFQSPDDPAARERVEHALAEMFRKPGVVADIELLEIYSNQPPRLVRLTKVPE